MGLSQREVESSSEKRRPKGGVREELRGAARPVGLAGKRSPKGVARNEIIRGGATADKRRPDRGARHELTRSRKWPESVSKRVEKVKARCRRPEVQAEPKASTADANKGG